MQYPLAANTLGQEEIQAAKAVLDSGMLTMGAQVAAFEAEFAEWTGAKHALFVNSGSSANLLAIDVLLRRARHQGLLKVGDEVLVPALSWPTTIWPIVQLGLKPVYVDICPKTLAISLESAESVLTSKTRALFLIHVLGLAADMDQMRAFTKKHNLVLIEDSCESLGSFYKGQHVGTFGVAGTFSCYFSHHISTIEGGVVITGDSELYDDLRSLRAHGWVRDRSDKAEWAKENPEIDPRFMFVMPGYNLRPMELQAAIGRIQLKKLDQMIGSRVKLAQHLKERLEKTVPWLELIGSEYCLGTRFEKRYERRHSWMTLPLRIKKDAPLKMDALKEYFHQNGVDTRPIIAGNMARHPASKRLELRSAPSLAASDDILKSGFMLGCHPVISKQAQETFDKAIEGLARF